MPHFDLENLLQTVGYIGIFLIIYAETGLLIGFFLPGDSLLFTAGILASQGYFNIWLLASLCFIAAVVGDATGYWIGHRYGRRLYDRPDSRFFKKSHLVKAEEFFAKHGGKALILARFTPIVRTFTPVVAGTAAMKYSTFTSYNVIGGLIWGFGVTVAGYYFGSLIPNIDTYLLPITGLIIIASILPGVWHIWKENGEQIKAEARKRISRGQA